jgi:hypothetical protein
MMLFYFIVGMASVLGATAAYLFLRRWGRVPALIGVLLGFFFGGLLFPFPIHGGVTFLGAVLWEELSWWAQRRVARREERRDEDFRRTLEQRFAGDLPFVPRKRLQGLWMEAMLEDGSIAWYDTESGLAWSDAQTVPSWEPGGDIEPGRRFCSEKPPTGYWALPTEGELFMFWEHAGHRLSPWTGQSTPSVLVDEMLNMQLPVWYRGSGKTVAVRCVARSPRAPKVGYLQSDIELSQWNRYQMDKAEALRGTR